MIDEIVEHSRLANASADEQWKFPLMLSALAGASTCVGAAVVFVFTPATIREGMTFSLALAGSVMITVSVVSIGPECLHDIRWTDTANGSDSSSDRHPHLSALYLLFARLSWFAAGCLGCILLSKMAFPEPTELLFDSQNNDTRKTQRVFTTDEPSSGSISTRPVGTAETPSSHSGSDRSPSRTGSDEAAQPAVFRRNVSQEKFGLGQTNARNDRDSDKDGDRVDNGVNSRASTNDNRACPKKGTKGNTGRIFTRQFLFTATPTSLWVSVRRLFRWSSGADLQSDEAKRSWRVAMLLFVSLLCHNFPEGLAVAASTIESPHLGVTVAVGIFVHNIPEGIAIAVPCLAARPDSPTLAFLLASGSGLAEPLGAFLALCVLPNRDSNRNNDGNAVPSIFSPFLTMECILAGVAGIMISVALIELYPEAWRHGMTHWKKDRDRTVRSIALGSVLGTVLMTVTELCI